MTLRISKLLCLPIALVIAHTLLVEAAIWIELDNAWNDQNPTMLVMLAMGFLDAPVIGLLEQFVALNEQAGTFFFALKLVGGVYWFTIGMVLSLLGVGVSRAMAAPSRLHERAGIGRDAPQP